MLQYSAFLIYGIAKENEELVNNPKIVAIGAGSASFSLEALGRILNQPEFQKATLCMVDTNEESLKTVYTLAKKIKHEKKTQTEIIAEPNRRKVLYDADFVILSVAVDRENTWEQDYKIAKKFGIWHYAENGGPGSFGHTARNIGTVIPILNDIHDYAPDAWLINFTNPLPRIHYAAKDYAKIKCISFCHQFWYGNYILGRILAQNLNIKVNTTTSYFEFRNASLQEYDILAAGLNHFTWMLDVRRKSTGEDMYPLIRQYSLTMPPTFEALTFHLFRTFGLLPVPGETHLSEYLPYTARKENWKKYNLYHYNFEEGKENRERNWKKIKDLISGKLSLEHLYSDPAERIVDLILELFTNANCLEPAVNIENDGSISNLPDDAIVEVPCIVNRSGAVGVKVGELPEAIAALCQREISIAKLITQASVLGDRNSAIQAFALDPMVNDLDLAERLVSEYLEVFRASMPQFFKESDVLL